MSASARGVLGELSARIQPSIVRLSGLNSADLHAMLVNRGFQISTADIPALRMRTGGVPLLALAALQGGHGVLDARLCGVSVTAATMADLLAVAGPSTSLAVLDAAMGLDESELGSALDELMAAGVLRAAHGDPIAVEFTHPLYREVIQARLSDHRRLLLSRRLTAVNGSPKTVTPSAPPSRRLALAEPVEGGLPPPRPHRGRTRRRRGH
jgi:hypothetical protein